MSDQERVPSDFEQLYQELLRKAEVFEPTAEDSAAAVLRAEVRRLRADLAAARKYSHEQFLARVEALRLADARTKERDRALAEVERLTRANEMLCDSAPKEWALRVDEERRGLEDQVERLRRELDDTNAHLGGLLRQSIIHQADRDALKERKNARIRELRAQVERLKADAASILEAKLSALPEDLAEVTRERDDLARKLEFVLKDRDQLVVQWQRWEREALAQRDSARDALRQHLAGQLLPADAYPWLDESDADEMSADYPRCPQCSEQLLNQGRVCMTHGEQP